MNFEKIYDVEKIIANGYGKDANTLAKEICLLFQDKKDDSEFIYIKSDDNRYYMESKYYFPYYTCITYMKNGYFVSWTDKSPFKYISLFDSITDEKIPEFLEEVNNRKNVGCNVNLLNIEGDGCKNFLAIFEEPPF